MEGHEKVHNELENRVALLEAAVFNKTPEPVGDEFADTLKENPDESNASA